MAIRFIKDSKKFVLNTAHTTYAFDVFNDRYLRHIYYGKRTKNTEPKELRGISFAPYIEKYGYFQD